MFKNILFLTAFFCCSTFTLDAQELTTGYMERLAINKTKMLEETIQRMVDYGKQGENAEKWIDEVILKNFLPDAEIETGSITVKGVKRKNPPITYKEYFMGLWNTSHKKPSLRIYFSDLHVVKTDLNRYQVTVQFVQEYSTDEYGDTTTKNVDIHIKPVLGKNKYVVKIGDTTFQDIVRHKVKTGK